MALYVPGEPVKGMPRSRARGLSAAARATSTVHGAMSNIALEELIQDLPDLALGVLGGGCCADPCEEIGLGTCGGARHVERDRAEAVPPVLERRLQLLRRQPIQH